jgi:S1-C subfamily serine protease
MEFTPGVYVAEVLNGGSAAAAGIQSGDVITKINGKNVTSLPELREMVGRSKVGDTLVVLVKRKNKEFEIPVKLRVRNG